MKQKRKRAPGGGRKPRGPFAHNAAQLTIRMPDDMRAQLEAAAQKKGWSLTQEVLWRLRKSLVKEREANDNDPATRALCFLISSVARGVHMDLPVKPEWHRNPFLFKAFRLAVAKLLDSLAPSGEVRPPYDEIEQTYMQKMSKPMSPEQTENLSRFLAFLRVIMDLHKTPERTADSVAADTLHHLLHLKPLVSGAFESFQQRLDEKWAQGLSELLQHEAYAMSDARRDLGIAKPNREPQ